MACRLEAGLKAGEGLRIPVEELIAGVVYSENEIREHINTISTQYPDTKIKRVCGYGRVSTKYAEQLSSLQTQHTIFSSYCDSQAKNGYVLVEEIYEQASGTLIQKRKKFMDMIERARAGEFDVLLFKDSKRFSRNTEDFLSLIEELLLENIGVVFISEGVNTLVHLDRQLLTMLGMMAESYSNALHFSTSAAIKVRNNSELGRVPACVFGYRRNPENSSLAEIQEDESELILELFQRYAQGEGLASIRDDWNRRQGASTYRGKKFSTPTLRRYLSNPLYKGVLITNKFTKPSVRAKRVMNPEDEWIVKERPDLRIVSEELWDECNRIKDTNRRKQENCGCFKQSETDKLKNMLFKRVIRCGECGRYYNRKSGGSRKYDNFKYTYLMCGYKKYSKGDLAGQNVCTNDETLRLDTLIEVLSVFISDLVENQLVTRETIREKIISNIKKKRVEENKELSDDEYKKAKEKLKRMAVLYKEGDIEEDEYRGYKAVVKKMEDDIKAMSACSLSDEEVDQLVDKFINNLKNIAIEQISSLQGEEAKAFNKLFKEIVVYKDHIDIVFRVTGKRFEYISIQECLSSEHRDIHFICPEIDNDNTRRYLLDKIGEDGRQYICPEVSDKVSSRYSMDKYKSIEWKDLTPKDKKRLRRKHILGNQFSTRSIQILGLKKEHIANMHTNQVVAGLRDIDINLYVV